MAAEAADTMSQPLLDPPADLPSDQLGGKYHKRIASMAFLLALVNTCKSVFGTGLLAMPFAFVTLQNLPFGCALCVLLGMWSCYTMLLIYKSTLLAWPMKSAAGYSALAQAALGDTGRILCSSNLVVHQLFAVATYLVFISDSLRDVFGGQKSVYTLSCVLPLLILCWLRDVRAIGPASAIGTGALAITLCLVLHEGCSDFAAIEMPSAAPSAPRPTLSALATFAGIAIFTFAGHDSVVPVVLSLDANEPKHAPYDWVVLCLTIIAIPGVLGFSATAAACFDQHATKNILLAVHGSLAAVLKVLMATAIFFTCPIKLFPAFEICEGALGLAHVMPAEDQLVLPDSTVGRNASEVTRHVYLRNALRSVLVAIAATVAIACPDFEFLVAFIGAFCNSLISFVLPPVMYCMLLHSTGRLTERPGQILSFLLHALLAVMGVCVFLGSTYKVVGDKLLGE